MALGSLASAFGILAAPALYSAGRLIRSSDLAAKSVLMDEHYLRGYLSCLHSRQLRSDMFVRFSQAAKICASTTRPIDDEMRLWFPQSHGQLLQDLVCLLLLGGKRDGYFVEVGAGDGTTYSNTLMLERDFGWNGILVEPARMFHQTLATSRRAALDRRGIDRKSGGTLPFVQNETFGELSGFAGALTKWDAADSSTYEIETVRLDDLLDEHRAPDEIDYLSIDTEGWELAVLEGLSLTKRRIKFLTIEHNFDTKRSRAYDRRLLPAGYSRIVRNVSAFDAWYLHKDFDEQLFLRP
jgi:FkbM family methyltransferase